MNEIYDAPQTLAQGEQRVEKPNLARSGALSALYVAAGYSLVFLAVMLLVGKRGFSDWLVWLVFLLASAVVSVVVTVVWGGIVNALLSRIGHRSPLCFCLSVLLLAALLMLVAFLPGWDWLQGLALTISLYGLPIAWIGSSRLLSQERRYRQWLSSSS